MEDTSPHPQRLQQRKRLRQHMRTQRKALTAEALAAADAALCDAVFGYIDTLSLPVRHMAAYLAINGEAPLGQTIAHCHAADITVYLPVIRDSRMDFAPYAPDTALTRNRLGIAEPDVDASRYIDPLDLDLVLVPLVAFTLEGDRLGMGGGYYDRTFEARLGTQPPPVLAGIAHTLQQADDVFVEDWDVPLDAIITDGGIIQQRNSR